MGAAPATGGKSSSLEHSTQLHSTAILIALKGSATHPCMYPASVHCATAVVGAHLTREEVIAALLSPSIKWMGEFDEVGNAQKFAFTEICTTPEKLPTQTYPPPLLAQLRAPPLFPPSANCRQQLQPEDCCRLCSHWIACQRADVDFNPHNISCPA